MFFCTTITLTGGGGGLILDTLRELVESVVDHEDVVELGFEVTC